MCSVLLLLTKAALSPLQSYLLPSDLTQSFSFFKIDLFIWLYWVLVVAWAIYGTWPPAWGAWSLSDWTTREVPV